MDVFKILALSEDFVVSKKYSGYDVEPKYDDAAVLAFINDDTKKITYYATDCSDSDANWIEIDINELMKLKEFCELILELEKE